MKRQEERRMYILTNYVLENAGGLEQLKQQYPTLTFDTIVPGIYTIEADQEDLNLITELRQNISFISSPVPYGLNAREALSVSNILMFHNYPYGELRGRGVAIGFVDTGIDYTNALFKNANNTSRIVGLWDQTIEGNPPSGFSYGTAYTTAQLNEALNSPDPYAVVPSRDENGHGTFLAGIAAGNDQTTTTDFTGGAPDAAIIMVKLRPASNIVRQDFFINEGEPAYQNNDIIAGVNYLFQTAVQLQLPLVICLGVGTNYGAHNGTDILEEYLASISSAPNIITICAVGNEGSSGHHYRGSVIEGGSSSLEINVGENETGFDVFTWVAAPDKITVSVRSPLGQSTTKIPILQDTVQEFQFNLERTVLRVTYLYPDPSTGGERIGLSFEAPTPGLWTISVYGEIIIDGTYNMWLPRRGFINDATRFLQPNPDITVQIPSTPLYVIGVGEDDYIDDSVYIASGRGPTTQNFIKPDFLAPGVNVEGPSIDGGFTTYIGTSTAAAITASAAALLLEWAVVEGNLRSMNTRIARGILIRGARRKTGVSYPNNIEGYGRLDLQASIANI